jgi:hypothetical protein
MDVIMALGLYIYICIYVYITIDHIILLLNKVEIRSWDGSGNILTDYQLDGQSPVQWVLGHIVAGV